jgi:PPK2 family polyphosphate:nucleotide phosphotransferase
MEHSAVIVSGRKKVKLKQIDTAATGSFRDEEAAKEKLQQDILKLAELQEMLFAEGKQGLLVIFQGMDTSGKDSVIKHVMSGVNPQGCGVHSFKAPTPEENRHDYLRRHSMALSGRGKISIFNRSYYEDVTIARVHQKALKSGKLWEHRFEEINNFEKYLTENGYLILKFFLHISPEIQKERLLKRIEDPKKHWKFDVSDIREREFWSDYQSAYQDAFNHTSTDYAPWIVVPADYKWSARVTVAHLIVEALERMKPRYPSLSVAGEAQLKKARKLLNQE